MVNTREFIFDVINYKSDVKIPIDKVGPAIRQFFKTEHEKSARARRANLDDEN